MSLFPLQPSHPLAVLSPNPCATQSVSTVVVVPAFTVASKSLFFPSQEKAFSNLSHAWDCSTQYFSLLQSSAEILRTTPHLLKSLAPVCLSLHHRSLHSSCDLHIPVEIFLLPWLCSSLTTSPPVILFSLPLTSWSYFPWSFPLSPSVDDLVSYFTKIRKNKKRISLFFIHWSTHLTLSLPVYSPFPAVLPDNLLF